MKFFQVLLIFVNFVLYHSASAFSNHYQFSAPFKRSATRLFATEKGKKNSKQVRRYYPTSRTNSLCPEWLLDIIKTKYLTGENDISWYIEACKNKTEDEKDLMIEKFIKLQWIVWNLQIPLYIATMIHLLTELSFVKNSPLPHFIHLLGLPYLGIFLLARVMNSLAREDEKTSN